MISADQLETISKTTVLLKVLLIIKQRWSGQFGSTSYELQMIKYLLQYNEDNKVLGTNCNKTTYQIQEM